MKFNNKVLCISTLLVLACFTLSAAEKDPLAKYWQQTDKNYPAGKAFIKAASWAPGHFVITGTKTKGKYDSVSIQTIIGKEKGGWIIETTGIDKKGKETTSQMLFFGMDEAISRGDTSGISIGWIKNKAEDGSISIIEGEQLAFFNMMAKSTYEKLVVNIPEPKDGGALTVPAGNFAGTSYLKASVKVFGMTIESESWYNAAVPVNGMVKTQCTDGKTVTELLAFGFDGKSRL